MIHWLETVTGSIEFKSNNGNEELTDRLPAAGSSRRLEEFTRENFNYEADAPGF